MSKLLLTLDGGGIRGAATTQFLLRIDQTLQTHHGCGLRDCVDFYAGTSTGSIIALALGTTSLSVEALNDLYGVVSAQAIFAENRGWFEIDGINAGSKSMKREIRDDMAMDFRGEKMVGLVEKALYENLYTGVAQIEATCLDEVFQVGNIGPESQITRLDRMASVSVGDLIEDEDGNRHVVANFGFKEVA